MISIVKMIFICSFLFYCLLCNPHLFQHNPKQVPTNLFSTNYYPTLHHIFAFHTLWTGDQEGDSENGFYVPPNVGKKDEDYWTDSPLAADHVAAGSFTTAMKLLHRQIGAINFVPLKTSFLKVNGSSTVLLNGLPGKCSK